MRGVGYASTYSCVMTIIVDCTTEAVPRTQQRCIMSQASQRWAYPGAMPLTRLTVWQRVRRAIALRLLRSLPGPKLLNGGVALRFTLPMPDVE